MSLFVVRTFLFKNFRKFPETLKLLPSSVSKLLRYLPLFSGTVSISDSFQTYVTLSIPIDISEAFTIYPYSKRTVSIYLF